MKKCLLFLFLLCTVSVLGQTKEPVTGFLGLSFGESKHVVEEKLSKYDILDNENLIYLQDVTFLGDLYEVCLIKFYNDKMYQGVFQIDATKINAKSFVNNLRRKLEYKYGYSAHYEIYDSEYYIWNDGENKIMLTLDDQSIMLYYTQTSLEKSKKQSELNNL